MGLIIEKNGYGKWHLNIEGQQKYESYKDHMLLNEIWEKRNLFETRSETKINNLKDIDDYCDPTLYLIILIQSYRNEELRMQFEMKNSIIDSDSKMQFSREWNQLRKDNMASPIEVWFNNAEFTRVHFENADFWQAQLANSNIYNSNCEFANFFAANLTKAVLKRSKLQYSYFKHSYLDSSDLSLAELSGCEIVDSQINNARLVNIDITTETSLSLESTYTPEFPLRRNLLGNSVILFLKSSNSSVRKKAISCLLQNEVNNARFIDPVFGREVRDEAWLYHYKKDNNFKYKELLIPFINLLFIIILVKICYWLLFCEKKFITHGSHRKHTFPNPKKQRSLLLNAWYITSNYGRNIWLWLIWSVMLSVAFAFTNYCFLGDSFCVSNAKLVVNENSYVESDSQPNVLQTNEKDDKIENEDIDYISLSEAGIWTSAYYSVVTFTTLGFGDVIPEVKSVGAKISVILEVIIGYLMLGGLISIFSNKLARRND